MPKINSNMSNSTSYEKQMKFIFTKKILIDCDRYVTSLVATKST